MNALRTQSASAAEIARGAIAARIGRLVCAIAPALLFVVLPLLLSCRSNETAQTRDGKVRLTVWGLPETDRFAGFFEAVREFERRHPEITVVMGTPGGQTNSDPQKLMTAIAGGAAPDLMWQDRFTIGGWASRDAFEPLDDFAREDGVTSATFYASCWEEATYRGHLYALPWDTDSRALYYNRRMLADAGIEPSEAFSDWNKLLDAADKLTSRDAKGDYQTIGFFPLMGNNWLYLYGWLNGGEFMSADRTKVTLDDPRIVEALEWMAEAYKRVGGYEEMNSFMSSSQIEGMGDPFLGGRLGMKIDGNWALDYIARFKPDFDFGVVAPPPPPGRKSVTWSGGFAWAIPRGAPHPRQAWELAMWLCSTEAWRIANDTQMTLNAKGGAAITIPMLSASREVNTMTLERYAPANPNLARAFRTFVDLLEVSRTRPVTPVGQELWDEHARAIDQALLGLATPKDALREATKRVQAQLDAILSPPDRPTFDLARAVLVATGAILLAAALIVMARLSRLRRKEQLTRLAREELVAGVLFISPWLVGFLLFFLVPMVTSLILVFSNYDVLHPPRFVGAENFQNLLGFHRGEQGRLVANDLLFWKSLWNTLYIAILAVPITQILSLGLALLLNTEIRGVRIYRTAFYLPVIVPTVATAILWMWLLNPQTGLLNPVFNTVLAPFGLRMPAWFDDPDWARAGVVLLLVWACGSAMIIWLAGLKSIPNVYYEAAEMDGASRVHRFFFITLPLLTPYLFFNFVIGLIGTLQLFTEAYVLVSPPSIGPGDSLLLYVYYLFLNGFSYFRMGYACALAWLLFVIIFALTWFQFKLAPRWVHYD